MYSIRADNFCTHYNLDPDIVREELVQFKKLDKLVGENIDVFDLLPEPDKKEMRKKRKMKIICRILVVKMKKGQIMKKQREWENKPNFSFKKDL